MAASVVLTTFPGGAAARRFARKLVSSRLAACVTVLPGASSVYRWKGKVESAAESLLVIKTAPARAKRLERAVRDSHPYDLPELLVLSARGSKEYLSWVAASSR